MTEQRFDAIGRLLRSRDPYLFDLAKTDPLTPFNLTQVTSLSGVALLTASVDAGWRVLLAGDAEQVVERWDGRGSHSLTEYDGLLRPVAIKESGPDLAEHTLERFTYAGVGPDDIAHNLCGQLLRHDDPAGTVHVDDLSMAGEVLKHTRRFLLRTEPPDWPSLAADREALLETADGATTSYQFSPCGEPLEQTDALHNRQAFAYTIAGQLKSTRLTLAGEDQDEMLLVSNIHYNVIGQIESETAGNGVVTRHHHDAANGRLIELSAHKANGTPLHILKYRYDAVGNVLSIEDAAQSIRYFNNQRIEPTRTYRYDTLYQLIEACGCEARTGQSGPALPDYQALPTDPGHIANYTQTYHYDAGGNLLDLVHLGAQAHGRTLTRERYSNRCLPERQNRPLTEEDLANGFDANGNLRDLQPGQRLDWDLRNQLSAVQLIVRKDAPDDRECYVYDGGGQRVRKVNVSQTGTRTITREVRYLPGLEIRTQGTPGEILHVITVSAGSNNVQVLHWLAGGPEQVPQDQVRYSLNDHLGSSALELDEIANLISQEWYYPFGGTAYWAGRNAIEAKYKTVSYSGKERDATGLYYFGFRYYASWLQRWINPDPGGYLDGMNLFLMVGNNPNRYKDEAGCEGNDFNQQEYLSDFKDLLSSYFIGGVNTLDRDKTMNYFYKLLFIEDLTSKKNLKKFIKNVQQLQKSIKPPQTYLQKSKYNPDYMRALTFWDNLDRAKRFEPLDPDTNPPDSRDNSAQQVAKRYVRDRKNNRQVNLRSDIYFGGNKSLPSTSERQKLLKFTSYKPTLTPIPQPDLDVNIDVDVEEIEPSKIELPRAVGRTSNTASLSPVKHGVRQPFAYLRHIITRGPLRFFSPRDSERK
ncbi:RHS repeat domain-containing protein [Pseudomonas sp. TMB3-21]